MDLELVPVLLLDLMGRRVATQRYVHALVLGFTLEQVEKGSSVGRALELRILLAGLEVLELMEVMAEQQALVSCQPILLQGHLLVHMDMDGVVQLALIYVTHG